MLMSQRVTPLWHRAVRLSLAVAVFCLAVAPRAHAQSPYGLAARQTIPFVAYENAARGRRIGPGWRTTIFVHNPSAHNVLVSLVYLGAVGTATPGRLQCAPVQVNARLTAEVELNLWCPLQPGFNYGRVELTGAIEGSPSGEPGQPPTGAPGDPADALFLANAQVMRTVPGVFNAGRMFFAVEGFPQGNLSGNRRFAVVTGLKNGLVGGHVWRSNCFAAALNETAPAYVRLTDSAGNPLGGFASVLLDPPSGVEMSNYPPDVFQALNVGQGSHDNVTAFFSTASSGGTGGAGIVAACLVNDLSTGDAVLEVAKYLDNNDEGREHRTVVQETSFGKPFWIVPEVDSDLIGASNLHVAYFQHPDRVACSVSFSANNGLPYFDVGQMRLIDPDGNIAAGGPHVTEFAVNLDEKSVRHDGRNGRWLIEVGPDRALRSGGPLSQGGLPTAPYTLTCSSGNGHSQLDIAGHCMMACHAAGGSNNSELLCEFDNPFAPKVTNRCYY